MSLISNNKGPTTEHTTKQEILNKYRVLYKLTSPAMQKDNKTNIKHVFRFLLEAYQDMHRPSGELYLHHPVEVACIVAEDFGLGPHATNCALLHDVLVETSTTPETIQKELGTEIAEVVLKVTELTKASGNALDKRIVSFRRVLSDTSLSSTMAILIKIADCLYHMRMLDSLPADKQSAMADEAKRIYAPLAHILGLQAVRLELEDLWLRYTDKESYDKIARQVQATKSTRQGFLEDFIAPIQRSLEEAGLSFTIKGRTKTVASIWHKIHKRDIPFDEMHDLYAIRIVFDKRDFDEHTDCWLIHDIVTTLYEPDPDRLRNWLVAPRDSGYEALHITVTSLEGLWVEVQIRSTRMDHNAEHGQAAHWRYKAKNLAEELAAIETAWIEEARKLLQHQWKNSAKAVDLNIDSLYVSF